MMVADTDVLIDGMGDSLIAGIVLAHGGTLLTRNRRHFDRIPELSLGSI